MQTTRLRMIGVVMTLALCASCGWFDQAAKPRPLAPGAALDVYQVVADKQPGARAAEVIDSGETVYLLGLPVITAADVATVAKTSDADGTPTLAVTLTPGGSAKFGKATAALIGQRLAMAVNGRVWTAPKVNSRITTQFSLQGMRSQTEFDDVFAALTGE